MAKFQPKADPKARVTLVCDSLKARFPKFKTARLPRGLVFRNGTIEITHADFVQLEGDPDFEYQMQKNYIRVLKAGTALPKSRSIPSVVTNRPASTEEGSGKRASRPMPGGASPEGANESEIEKFDKAT